jgi:hypothetical protein
VIIDSKYRFLVNVLPDKDLSEEIKCTYPWQFNVEYFLFDQETGQEILTSESYHAINSTIFDQVEDRWRWDISLNIGGAELHNISLEEFNLCDRNHIN